MSPFFKNKTVRDTGFQVGFVGGLLILVVVFIITAQANLEAQGITSGFAFLERATGWQINFSLIEYKTNSPYWLALVVGATNSLFVAVISLTFATLIGVTVGTYSTIYVASALLIVLERRYGSA